MDTIEHHRVSLVSQGRYGLKGPNFNFTLLTISTSRLEKLKSDRMKSNEFCEMKVSSVNNKLSVESVLSGERLLVTSPRCVDLIIGL